MVSLPIPDRQAPVTYEDIHWNGETLGDVLGRLGPPRVKPMHSAHLDPDLRAGALPRGRDWRPAFGQTSAAQGHLRNHDVGPGDLFLFFGLFRRVGQDGRFLATEDPFHALWGWMQVAQVYSVDEQLQELEWAKPHPHLARPRDPTNTIYAARKHLSSCLGHSSTPGGGTWDHFHPGRRLTKPGVRTTSPWSLPDSFHPVGRASTLSYHGSYERWTRHPDGVYLDVVGRGQEFVLDLGDYPEVTAWVRQLFG